MESPAPTDDRTLRQQAALVTLSRSDVLQSGDLDRALRQIVRVSAETIEVDRVSVWKLGRDPVEIQCLIEYELRTGSYTSGTRIPESASPQYFRAVSTSDIVAATDVAEDPRTRELVPSYLQPLGITSMMDVPIYGPQGRWGVLCHEHVGPPRTWGRDEQYFALGLANLVSAAVGIAESRDAEQRLQAYLENACDCMAMMDPQGRIVYANAAYGEVMGVTSAQIAAGLNVLDFVPEGSRSEARSILERLGKGETVRFQEFPLQRLDGRRVFADGSAWPDVRDGRPRLLFAHWRDATPEIERERHHRYFLEQSAGMFHYALRKPMPVTLPVEDQIAWLLDQNYLVECNSAHARFYGFQRPEDMVGRRFQDTYAEIDEAKAMLRQWIQSNYVVENIESRERTASGSVRWFLGFSRGVLENGHLMRSFGMRLDITDRKLAENGLLESEEKFRQISENIRDVFWMMDLREGRILYVSAAYESMFGRRMDALYERGGEWEDAVHPDDREALRKAHRDARKGEPFDALYRIRRGDGGERWIHDRGFPIRDEQDQPYRLVGIAEDVTDLKESEDALRESERRLAEALRHTQDRVVQLEDQVRDRQQLERLVGKSTSMLDVYRRVRLAAQSDVTVLVTGESGTGKELVASAIHSLSARRQKPYIAVNCTAIPEALLESEIFGHVKGAFTGATRDRLGLLQAAEGGTLFLDEIGDMPPALQAKLLRVLQERAYRRVGDEHELHCDVRIVAATNRDLASAVATGAMREDFFYRIRVFQIAMPPLRDRRDDIPLLVGHLIEELSRQTGRKIRGVAVEAMKLLMSHDWPGNVRELRNALEHAFVTVQGDTLRETDLPPEILAAHSGPSAADRGTMTPEGALERRRLEDALRRADGNRTKAAKLLGVSRVTLWKRMQKYGIAVR
jgi:PAS domain S-box-containing protein